MVNAAEADIDGVELELIYAPTENLYLSANFAYLDAYFGEFLIDTGFGIEDRSDWWIPGSPENKFNLAATYTVPMNSGSEVIINASYAWTDEFTHNRDSPQDEFVRQAEFQDSYGVVNASVAYITADEKWKLSLWGKTLADEEYFTKRLEFFGAAGEHAAAPITYGVSVAWNL